MDVTLPYKIGCSAAFRISRLILFIELRDQMQSDVTRCVDLFDWSLMMIMRVLYSFYQ